jgi:FtsP/CotA-like multicopper oxidase with cupredoxin domain
MASVHWHGIELESVYDGVGGWSGWGTRIAPLIAPNDSFIVRLTPDRAGTFIYHTHSDETDQLPSGLYGSLIVLQENAQRDTTERILLLGSGGPHGSAPAAFNGSVTPPPLELRAGVRHRLRLINIAAADAKRVRLVGDSTILWRAVAKDGADLPPGQATVRPATQLTQPGETFDFDLMRPRPEVLSLEITTLLPRGVIAVMKVPVIVR